MNAKALFKPQDEFSRGILVSIAAHFVVVCLLIFKAVLYPSEPIRMERAIRVDMVGLPDKKAELPAQQKSEAPAAPAPVVESKPEPKPEPKAESQPEPQKVALPKPEPKKTEAIDLKKTKDTQTSALKRLEALKRLQGASKPAPSQETKTGGTAPVKGNALSAGSSITGIAKIEHDEYITSIDDRIKEKWNLPAFLANANFKARIVVYLDSRGAITRMVMTQSSPNDVFNERCMEAVRSAAPFGAPPDRLVNIFAVDGFEVGFPE